VSGPPALSPERRACSGGRPLFPRASAQPAAGRRPAGGQRRQHNGDLGRALPGRAAAGHLGFEGEDLVRQLLLLLLQQLVDLVGFDPLAHQLEVGVVLLPQLLQQAAVLLLHVLEGLARDIHLAEQGFLLLKGQRRRGSTTTRGRSSSHSRANYYTLPLVPSMFFF